MLAGVWRARRDGRGADVDLSLFETALAQLTYIGDVGRLARLSSRGGAPNSAHQTMVPFQNFATADGWLVVACPKQALWERLCAAIERPELRRATSASRDFAARDRQSRRARRRCSSEMLRVAPTAEWLERARPRRRPCAPVNDVAAALADPQAAAREARRRVRAPGARDGAARSSSPFRLDGCSPRPRAGRCSASTPRERAARALRLRRRADRASSRQPASSATSRARRSDG